MPKRKKSNLSKKTKSARYIENAIDNQSYEQTCIRKNLNKSCTANIRSNESLEDKQSRNVENSNNTFNKRANESIEEKQSRNVKNNNNTFNKRANESIEEKQSRNVKNNNNTFNKRANESIEEKQSRYIQNRQNTYNKRENESTERKISRNLRNNVITKYNRSSENIDETIKRRTQDKVKTSEARLAETTEQHSSRILKIANNMTTFRSNEEDEQRKLRLNKILWKKTSIQWKNSSFHYNPLINYTDDINIGIGEMNIICIYCKAKKFKGEKPGLCCSSGKIKLSPLKEPLEPLNTLLFSNSSKSKIFLKNIRNYNSAFQMTSFGADNIIKHDGFETQFKVQGQVYHILGSLEPNKNESPKYVQLYFMGNTVDEARCRIKGLSFAKLECSIVNEIQDMLHRNNEMVKTFKYANEQLSDNYKIIMSAKHRPHGEHQRRFNEPTSNEVAVILLGDETTNRDIILNHKKQGMMRINEMHQSYDALQYPLIFNRGESGYNFNLKYDDNIKKLSTRAYYSYNLMMREYSKNTLLQFRELTNQFVVDMYAKIESERLLFVRTNQRTLRVDSYEHLKDAMTNDCDINELGKMLILPSTFIGSPRNMQQNTQDAMVYVRKYGSPDLFITFTCNPKWIEIKTLLENGQTTTQRHDIVARVFNQKLNKLKSIIVNGKIFGDVRCRMHTVEWQKRGLPHAHILLWLYKKIHASVIDSFLSAEIPDEEKDPALYEIVVANMIHGPCGRFNMSSPCMQKGKCSKKFPKRFVKYTITGEDGYPECRRRKPEDGGNEYFIKKCNDIIAIDNRWVVPYCPLLSKIFNAHINVEYCNSVRCIKYICKYINKGADMSMTAVVKNNLDECSKYELGRYISTNEAFWRIFSFNIHEHFPPIFRLNVHLENHESIFFSEKDVKDKVSLKKDTHLLAFFKLCCYDNFAKSLIYEEIPSYYIWKDNKWIKRKQGSKVGLSDNRKNDMIGRVYIVNYIKDPNRYFLRMLLMNVRGPTSFKDLLQVQNQTCQSYRHACILRGLLQDDKQWENTIIDAILNYSPSKLRNLFAVMLNLCSLSEPLTIWNKYKEYFADDYYQLAKKNNDQVTYSNNIFNITLIYIEDKLLAIGGKKLNSYGLPSPDRNITNPLSSIYTRETSYNVEELNNYISLNEPLLTNDQNEVYIKVLDSVNNNQEKVFFLCAPGGTGKTFLINLLLSKVRSSNKIAIAVASSGIASTLLENGKTAHSTFKLPLDLTDEQNTTCNITKNSPTAKLLINCSLIVWDECTMSHKGGIHAVDRLLKFLRGNDNIMGGITILFSGDFRQILPVCPNGSKADELKACIKYSHLWNNITQLTLTTIVRLQGNNSEKKNKFALKLLEIGDGNVGIDNDQNIDLCIGNIVNNYNELKEKVYENFINNCQNNIYLGERAILAPINEIVDYINNDILNDFPGDLKTYKSIDSLENDEENIKYPNEYLNSLTPPGFPPHNLNLKKGATIILLRNLEPPKLCNGTRLVIKRIYNNLVEATIIMGKYKNIDVFIPKIPLVTSNYHIEFKRLQFPIKLSFAMTINKAQGQTLKVVGIHLETDCFSHGQLYVACSRITHEDNLYILTKNGKTKNIVYKEALR